MGREFQLGKMKKLLRWRVAMVTEQHQCTYALKMVKMVNRVLYIFYHNKNSKHNKKIYVSVGLLCPNSDEFYPLNIGELFSFFFLPAWQSRQSPCLCCRREIAVTEECLGQPGRDLEETQV